MLMLLNRKKYRFIIKVIDIWQEEGTLSQDTADKLKGSLQIARFDWKRMAKYSFWIAGISLAISVFALVMNDIVLEILIQLFSMPALVKAIFLLLCSVAIYYWGFRRKHKKPEKNLSNEFLLFVGAISMGVTLVFFGKAVDTGSGHFSLLMVPAILVYLGVGLFFPSAPMWVLGLLSFCSWFGTETGYISGWGAYFLGMNYPLRFLLLGAGLVALSFLMERGRFARSSRSTFIVGLLNLFISLWLLSIYGNFGDMWMWHEASIVELLAWSMIFGLFAIGAIVWGLKRDDRAARNFGITFLFINLYTKYFEYFWDVAHKALFFAILAASFWILGRYSERIFSMVKEKIVDDSALSGDG